MSYATVRKSLATAANRVYRNLYLRHRFRHRLSAAERQRVNRQRDYALVGEGDEKAELALSRYEQRLAKSLAHVVNILDPDVIVLGGGMSNVERLYQTVPDW